MLSSATVGECGITLYRIHTNDVIIEDAPRNRSCTRLLEEEMYLFTIFNKIYQDLPSKPKAQMASGQGSHCFTYKNKQYLCALTWVDMPC